MLCGCPLQMFFCSSNNIGKAPAPIPKKGSIELIFKALMKISNLVSFLIPIPSSENSNQNLSGIMSLNKSWKLPDNGWKIVIENIILIITKIGRNHKRLPKPKTNGTEPIMLAQAFLEFVKNAAITIKTKKISEKILW